MQGSITAVIDTDTLLASPSIGLTTMQQAGYCYRLVKPGVDAFGAPITNASVQLASDIVIQVREMCMGLFSSCRPPLSVWLPENIATPVCVLRVTLCWRRTHLSYVMRVLRLLLKSPPRIY